MKLEQWLIEQYGVASDASSEPLRGVSRADALLARLVEAGLDYDRQRQVLRAAPELYHDHRFAQRCLDLYDEIGQLQRRLASTPPPAGAAGGRRRHSAVIARGDRPPAAPFAERRLVASRPDDPEVCDIVADFVERLVAEGYVENRPDVGRDLRQGLGYYRRGEDPLRRRGVVRWLHYQNELSHLVDRLLDDPVPLCRLPEGPDGRWQVTADLFCDAQGRAYQNLNFDHAELHDERKRRRLDALVPRLPAAGASGRVG